MRRKGILVTGIAVVWGAATAAGAEPSAPGTGAMFPSLLRLGLALIAVVTLVYAVSFILRRASRGRRQQRTRILNVLDVLPLGPKAKLVTVRVAGRILVVGAGESSVSRIAEIDPGEYREVEAGGEAPVIPFRDRLRRLTGK